MLTNSCVKLQTVHSIPLTINKEGGLSSQGLPSLSAVSTVFGTMGFLKECVCCLGPVGLSQEWMGRVRGSLSPAAAWLRRPMTLFLVTQHISDLLCSGSGPAPLASQLSASRPHLSSCCILRSLAHTLVSTLSHSQVYACAHACTRTTSHMPPLPFPVLGTLLCFTSVTGLPCCKPTSEPKVSETEDAVDCFSGL